MKGFFSWFKSGNKIKRWLILIIIATISVCYAIATIMSTETIDVKTIIKIVFLFVFGFFGISIGWISLQKRNLEILVKKTDKRNSVKSLIYDKKVFDQGPKIVVIGGGNGLNAVLKGLKEYTENITAVVIPGDSEMDNIKDCISALSSDEDEMNRLINFRLQGEGIEPVSFGDIYLSVMKNLNLDYSRAVEKTGCILNMTGKILPITHEQIEICAEYEDGSVVKGKSNIPNATIEKIIPINRVFINPSNVKATTSVTNAIKEADAIILGPGSLYTDVIPNLLVRGISKAIKESNGFKIYVSNIMTEPGQTDNYKLSDHIRAVNRHIGEGSVDYCIYDTGEIAPEIIRQYNMRGADLVEQDIQRAKAEGVKVLKRDLAIVEDNHIKHNSSALAKAVIELICDDLKFRDRQNDPDYLILKQKLKYRKATSKEENKWKKPKLAKDGRSKFSSKYQERISSLKESNQTAKRKEFTRQKNNQIIQRTNGMKKRMEDISTGRKK